MSTRRVDLTKWDYIAIREWYESVPDSYQVDEFQQKWGEGSFEEAYNALCEISSWGQYLPFKATDRTADMIEELSRMADEAGYYADEYESEGWT